MKISFDDGGYIEFQRSKKLSYVHVIVAARKSDNHLELLINSAEISVKQLIEAVKSVSGPIIEKGNNNEEANNKDTYNTEGT